MDTRTATMMVALTWTRAKTENHYCAGCLSTKAFIDHGHELECPVCSRTLVRRR